MSFIIGLTIGYVLGLLLLELRDTLRYRRYMRKMPGEVDAILREVWFGKPKRWRFRANSCKGGSGDALE